MSIPKNKKNIQGQNDVLDNFDSFLKNIRDEFGEGSIGLLEENVYKKGKETMSSGSFLLDQIICQSNNSGYVKGKIIEIFGLQSSGKSTLAFHAVKECQNINEKAVYFDLENGLDIEYIKNIGVDTTKLILPYPNSGEEVFEMMIKFIEMDVGLIVVDSVSNLLPKAHLESNLEKMRIGSHAALMSMGLRKLKNKLAQGKKTIVIFINQIRHTINTGFFLNSTETTTGGIALRYESDLRIKLKFKEKIEKGDSLLGVKIEAKIIKNRFSKPFGKTDLEIIYPNGISRVREIIKFAIDNKIIEKNGTWLSYKEKNLGQGVETAITFLKSNLNLYSSLEEEVNKLLLTTDIVKNEND